MVKVMNQEQLGPEQQHVRSRWTHDASSLPYPDCEAESRRLMVRDKIRNSNGHMLMIAPLMRFVQYNYKDMTGMYSYSWELANIALQ